MKCVRRSLLRVLLEGARAALFVLCVALTGCASLTNPVAVGVPAPFLPPELLAKPKDRSCSIPLNALGQAAPDVYRLDSGDVLGVWIDGVLGTNGIIPLNVAPAIQVRDQRRLPPGVGYPIRISENGTVVLPMIPPVAVKGMSVDQAEEAIRKVYVEKGILRVNREMLLVSLLQPRQHNIVVLRQEALGGFTAGADGVVSNTKRGIGSIVELPAYENDVLHVLGQTGGLPGLDAYNEVIIFRNYMKGSPDRGAAVKMLETQDCNALLSNCPSGQVIRIPLRLPHGAPLPFKPEDVILHTGDVVFLEARDRDLFFTGGLLPGGEHVLPRDHDLDVVEAVARVRGPFVNGGFGTNNLSGASIATGLGAPSPSLLTVLRKLPGGGRVPIRVDLNRALTDRREAILVQAGDLLILQEMPSESMARYFTQSFFNFNLVQEVVRSRFGSGIISIGTPDRLGINAIQPTIPLGQ